MTPSAAARAVRWITDLAVDLAGDERGQDLVEYALLTAAVGLAGAATWPSIAQTIGTVYRALDSRSQALWAPPDPGGSP
ncbi:MAG: Flp family type IVb pilin [Vicinamibacterales bacterium]